jgi:hypothetical protein
VVRAAQTSSSNSLLSWADRASPDPGLRQPRAQRCGLPLEFILDGRIRIVTYVERLRLMGRVGGSANCPSAIAQWDIWRDRVGLIEEQRKVSSGEHDGI